MRTLLFEIEDEKENLLYYIIGDDTSGYGLEIEQEEGKLITRRTSELVFKRRSYAENYLKAMYEGRVYPVHLCDIIEDDRENIDKLGQLLPCRAKASDAR